MKRYFTAALVALQANSTHVRALRFVGVGGVSTIVYWIAVLVLAGPLKANPTLSSVIAYFLGFLAAYFGHRTFTYKSSSAMRGELRRFLTMHAACFSIGNLAFWFTVSRLGTNFVLAAGVLTVVSFTITYAVSELWVFEYALRAQKTKN